jgi:hypothetical protein
LILNHFLFPTTCPILLLARKRIKTLLYPVWLRKASSTISVTGTPLLHLLSHLSRKNAQAITVHESPRTTKLYDCTGDEITLDEVEGSQSDLGMSMAILTRRGIRELLDDGPVNLETLNKHFVDRLNGTNEQTLATEWELIVLSALSRVGAVEYEAGSTLDFRFSAVSGLRMMGDVTCVSDEEAIRSNPIQSLANEIQRRMTKNGITGELTISALPTFGDFGKVRLRLPPPHEFVKHIFDAQFRHFVKAIISSPTERHSLIVDNAAAQVSIRYAPAPGRMTMIHHLDFTRPGDLENNLLYNRLESKLQQVKKVPRSGDDGLRGVVVCDGGCSLFDPRLWSETIGFAEIARHFLSQTSSLDFVASITVKEQKSHLRDDPGRYGFSVQVFDAKDDSLDGIVGDVLREGLRNVPKPIRTPINARHSLGGKLTALRLDNVSDTTLSYGRLALSARAVVDYICGQIDRQQFEGVVAAHGLGVLKRDLNNGGLVTSIKLLRYDDLDDDQIELCWKESDETVSRFKPREG